MGETKKLAVAPIVQEGGSLLTAEQLTLLSELLANEGKAEITSFKQLYAEFDADKLEAGAAELETAGLLVSTAGSTVKNVIACNFCKGAEEAGLDLARRLDRAVAGMAAPMPLKVGYAGCALGTSEPLLKDIAVVKMKNRFDLYVGGDPRGIKPRIAQLLVEGLGEDSVVPAVLALIRLYVSSAERKTRFSRFVEQAGMERLRQVVKEEGAPE
ncbi:nitrite reductase [Cohnella zeiphila]|uniref:Nitrite reductase n=1 Tax=Cohnella zeiphila TaxID=2761120 RepID=A0A7X0SRB9_9BACL|nr:nitrite reductase [Cohnella zeiphila]MBB6733679.1 nitrite reductase [Cohnella zeiphila]